MKMFLIVYCDAADEAVIETFKKSGVRGYTKMREVRGEGTDTEPKLGTHCWPGKNHASLSPPTTARQHASRRPFGSSGRNIHAPASRASSFPWKKASEVGLSGLDGRAGPEAGEPEPQMTRISSKICGAPGHSFSTQA